MRSCDFSNFQFESYYDETRKIYMPVSGSERLICPECKHEHREPDKVKMNRNGAYVHRFPERKDLQPSFQFGALASQFPFMSWDRIAGKMQSAGKVHDIPRGTVQVQDREPRAEFLQVIDCELALMQPRDPPLPLHGEFAVRKEG